MPNSPEELIRVEVRSLSPYHVSDASGMVKLDAMENPYRLPQPLRSEIATLVAEIEFNRYPDAAAKRLKAKLRETMGIRDDFGIILGNGSDELIQIVVEAINQPGAVLMSLEPSFVMYRLITRTIGIDYVGVPLTESFALDSERLLAAIEASRPSVLFLAYPNNPTGNLFGREEVLCAIAAAPGLVVIDEAYHPFAQSSLIEALADYPNLLVMRTLSKLGLAGLRLGFLVGARRWIDEFEKIRLPYNVNALTQTIAEKVLAHGEVLESQAQAIREQRGALAAELSRLAGVEVFPSAANFLLFRLANANLVFEELKARRILVKKLNGSHPALRDCLRVTVGTPEENQLFIQALAEITAR
jgi:histidinol-phosphate aminotransferase